MLVREPDGMVMSVCETVMVSFDPDTATSTPLDPEWRRLFQEYEQRDLSENKSV